MRECLIRSAVWLLAVIVGVVPSVHAAHARLGVDIVKMAALINQAGYFRDFFFVVIVMSVFSFSNIIDHLFRDGATQSGWPRALGIIVSVYYLIIVIYGTLRFDEASGQLDSDDLSYDLTIVGITLGVSLVTEIGIALRIAYVPE